MAKRRTSRVYGRGRGGETRFYADLRDLGGGREALVPEGETRATTDRDVAEKLAQKRVTELEQGKRGRNLGVVSSTDPITLASAARIHLEEKARLEDVTVGWMGESEHQLRRAVEFFGEARALDSIKPAEIRDWIQHLGTVDNGRGGTLSGGTVRHHINTLSNLFGTALEKDWVLANPVAGLRRGTKPKAKRHEAAWFEAPEASLILEAAMRCRPRKAYQALPFSGPLVATLLLTGGRKSEVLGLLAEDVSFDRGLIHFRPNPFRRLKTGNASRTVPLWPQLREILQRHIFESGHVEGLLFPSPGDPSKRREGARMVQDLEKILDGIAEVLGWEKGSIRSKAFRHTYCSARLQTVERVKVGEDKDGRPILEAVPVSPFTVAREMGHGGDSLVKRVYGHLGTVRHRSEAVEFRVEQHRDVLGDRLQRLLAWQPPRCRGTSSTGERCQVGENLSPEGFCLWHDPKRTKEARKARPHALYREN